jgi:hypothetical protein
MPVIIRACPAGIPEPPHRLTPRLPCGIIRFAMDARDPIIVIFGREQVRRCKLAHFLKLVGPADLLRFIARNFGPLNAMMERAGMSERAIYERSREVFHHFHLPYDAPPPEDE